MDANSPLNDSGNNAGQTKGAAQKPPRK